MIRVFSQKIKQETFDIVYDCLINPESNNVGYTHVIEYPNGRQVNSFFVMDFLTLKEFINNGQNNYVNEKIQFTEKDDSFEFISNNDGNSIILPKNFLFDTFKLLEKMWESD
jgi:hypothetical protein